MMMNGRSALPSIPCCFFIFRNSLSKMDRVESLLDFAHKLNGSRPEAQSALPNKLALPMLKLLRRFGIKTRKRWRLSRASMRRKER